MISSLCTDERIVSSNWSMPQFSSDVAFQRQIHVSLNGYERVRVGGKPARFAVTQAFHSRRLTVLGAPRHAIGTLGGVAHHPDELVSELLPGCAVQEEVHRVIDVHQQLGDGARQAELGDPRQVLLEGVTEGRRYARHVHRQCREEEGERYREQHDRQSGVALGRRSPLFSHAAVQLTDPRRAQFVAMVPRL